MRYFFYSKLAVIFGIEKLQINHLPYEIVTLIIFIYYFLLYLSHALPVFLYCTDNLRTMNRNLLTLVFLLASCMLFAQDSEITRCGFMDTNSNVLEDAQNFERWINDNKASTFSRNNEVLQIPVVFHIIHSGTTEGTGFNLSASLIEAQLEQVNNDLRKRAGTSGDNEFLQGADSRIELVPAIYDENLDELLQPGINRISASSKGFTSGSYSKTYMNSIVKPATQWDPNLYFNIWVCDLSPGLLGFAQFPDASGVEGINSNGAAATDGVVLLYKTVGSTEMPNPLAGGAYTSYNKGRTFTHELGHSLGLRHIWGDGSCSMDDYCSDTPTSDGANYGCPNTHYSCGTVDMTENYMDYTYDACMSVFTEGQKERMRTVLFNADRRIQLLASDRGESVGVLPVEVLSYDANLERGQAYIKWTTASETNNDYFVLSKSTDGIRFEEIAIIQGAGNSLEETGYLHIDKELAKGENYYQLIQVDFDGTRSNLGVRIVTVKGNDMDISIYPNPTRSDIMLNIQTIASNEIQVQLFNANGVLVKNYTEDVEGMEEAKLKIELDNLAKGIYFVRVISGEIELTDKFNKI